MISWLRRLKYYFKRDRYEREMAEELNHHLALAAAEAEKSGATPEEARFAAQRRVGAPGRVADASRDVWRLPRLESVLQDLRYAGRGLRRQPMHTLAAVVTLALGIGATTAIASVLASVLYTPLPFDHPERLVQVWENNLRRSYPRNVVSPANFMDWRDRATSFSGMAIYVNSSLTLLEDKPEPLDGYRVSANMLSVLGVKPALGRDLLPTDAAQGAPRVLLLSHATWQRSFHGDSSIVGKAVRIREGDAIVAGVLPEKFHALETGWGDASQGYLEAVQVTEASRVRRGRYAMVMARLKDGVSVEQAGAELRKIAADLVVEHPEFNTGWSATALPLMEQVVGSSRAVLAMVTGAIALVLLIACANVAGLAVARTLGRRGELSLRTALGATGGRIVRLLTVEGLVLATLGGALGVALGFGAVGALRRAGLRQIPRVEELHIDPRVLVLAILVTTGAGLVCGLLPGLGLRRASAGTDLMGQSGRSTTSRGGTNVRGSLVVLQVALSLLLLAGTGLLVRSLIKLLEVNPGFDSEGVLTAEVSLPPRDYPTEKVIAFYDQLGDRLRNLPGVEAAGLTNGLPFTPWQYGTSFYDAGQPAPAAGTSPIGDIRTADVGLFAALRIPVLRGRGFDATDLPNGRLVCVVNRALAEQIWGGGDPLGHRLQVAWGTDEGIVAEVVGEVGDVNLMSLDVKPRPTIYFSARQQSTTFNNIALRVKGDPASFVPMVTRELAALDPNLPLVNPRPMTYWTGRSTANRRYPMLLLALLAGVALVLAAVGLYGVLAYFVGERTREIGVRRALGAPSGSVVGLVLGQGARLVALGLALGGLGAIWGTRFLRGLLYQIGTGDPGAIAGAVVVLGAVGLAASLLPALRAAKVDPAVTLRGE